MSSENELRSCCPSCGFIANEKPVTCPRCGDWINERRMYE
jgi:predicted Zn-ribbon and HTH transcriptional regulator